MNEHQYAAFGQSAFGTVSGSRISRIQQYAGNSILDVGCGPGLYLERLKGLGYEVAGADGNSIFLEQASKHSERVYPIDLDTDALSRFPDVSFDTILLFDVLEHVRSDQTVLQDAARIARKNVLVSVPAQLPDGMKNSQLVPASYVDPTHRRYYTFESLEQLLQQSGFRSYQIEPILRFTPVLYGIFPWYYKHPLRVLERFLERFSDPKLLTSVWFATGWK